MSLKAHREHARVPAARSPLRLRRLVGELARPVPSMLNSVPASCADLRPLFLAVPVVFVFRVCPGADGLATLVVRRRRIRHGALDRDLTRQMALDGGGGDPGGDG